MDKKRSGIVFGLLFIAIVVCIALAVRVARSGIRLAGSAVRNFSQKSPQIRIFFSKIAENKIFINFLLIFWRD